MKDTICTPFFSACRGVVPLPRKVAFTPHDCHAEKEAMILTSANSAYVIKFTENYLNSLVDKGIDFHCIVMDDTSSQEEKEKLYDFLQTMKNKYKFFSCSIEAVPDIFDKRTYFAMNRFLKAGQFLQDRKAIVITDMDYQLQGNWNTFINAFDSHDILLNINEDTTAKSMLPWFVIIVNTVAIKNTQTGWNFLSLYKDLFYRHFCPNGYNWGLDQNIAGAIYHRFRDAWSFMNICKMPERHFSVPYELKRQK